MEVGAVKQAFNNELILLKKKLNQAKIQTINKLTRKAKNLTEKKAPEQLKDKLKRKAESAVIEVMTIKKVKVKDIAKFIITHTGELKGYLNKPKVDSDKVCARLLLHKSMQDKYKFIRGRFNSVPIEDLLMSREERLKIKKEARDKQKNKKKRKGANKAVNSEGDWDVEDVEMGDNREEICNINESSDSEGGNSEAENKSDHNSDSRDESQGDFVGERDSESEKDDSEDDIQANISKNEDCKLLNERNDDGEIEEDVGKFVKLNPIKTIKNPVVEKAQFKMQIKPKLEKRIKPEKKFKHDKNKNFKEKILLRKFKKGSEEAHIEEKKVVDPFFITATGENYMSVAEPRQPDEVKEIHKQGNRKLRRAVMFGHVPKVKPRQNNFRQNDNRFDKPNGFDRSGFKTKFNDTLENNNDRKFKSNDGGFQNEINDVSETKPEKLHPSWEAKKRQSGILPFKGKKIVFDES